MRYRIAAVLAIPPGTPPLRRYRRFRTVNLISEFLIPQSRMSRPDGAYATVVERAVSGHDQGADVTLILDAPDLAFAERTARQLTGLLVRHFRELAGWTVPSCAATFSDEDLRAAMGPLSGHP